MTDIAERGADDSVADEVEEGGGTNRRRFLAGGAVAAAAAVAGVALTADPAGAANGGNMIIGGANVGTTQTSLTGSTFRANNGANSNTAIIGSHLLSQSSIGVYGEGYAAGATYNLGGVGVKGVSGEGGTGVLGIGSGASSMGSTGIKGSTGYGVGVMGETLSGSAGNAGDYTGQALRGHSDYGAALFLDETSNATIPIAGIPWSQGSFTVKGGHLWYCYKSGTPGSWVRLSSSFVPLPAPKRVYDTRAGEPPTAIGPKTPISGERAGIDLKANSSGVPAGISGALISVVSTGSTVPGFAAFYKTGIAYPGTSNLNYAAGQTVAVTTFTAVNALSQMNIYSLTSSNYVVDVLGYYI